MCATSADPNTIQIDITFVDNQTGLVHMETDVWDITHDEQFVGIALVTTTEKKQTKRKLLKTKK